LPDLRRIRSPNRRRISLFVKKIYRRQDPEDMTSKPSEPGLCLVAPAERGAEWQARVAAALDATRAETLILTAREQGAFDPAVAQPLVDIAQKRTVAALIADDIATARATGADGVHLHWRPEIEDAYEAARSALGPDAIVGADAGISRHDAMTLGESGADYVAFGLLPDAQEPAGARDTQRDLVSWWADVFVVPVVAFDAETADDVRDFVRQGVDFVAVRLPSDGTIEKDAAWASALVEALTHPADAA
jgi:thiamine-phosphate pyrophosphorylase